jgi:hypothetical protein
VRGAADLSESTVRTQRRPFAFQELELYKKGCGHDRSISTLTNSNNNRSLLHVLCNPCTMQLICHLRAFALRKKVVGLR